MKDGAAVTDERANYPEASSPPPSIHLLSAEEPKSEVESGVLLSEPTAYLTGDLSAFQTSFFAVDSSDEVIRDAKRRSIRRGILTGILIGFPTMLLMFGVGYVETDWEVEHLTFGSEGSQDILSLQNEVDSCDVDGDVYDGAERGSWFSTTFSFIGDCDGNLHLQRISVLYDLTFLNGSATATLNLSTSDERCEFTLRVRDADNEYSSIVSSYDIPDFATKPTCDNEHVLNANIYFEQEEITRDLSIGTVNIEGDLMTLIVNQTNISSLGNTSKQALLSIHFVGWWDDSDISEPGPVIGYVDGSTLRFTPSAPLDVFTTPNARIDYRIQGSGMSGEEADATIGIMMMLLNGLCCFGLFLLPLGVSMRKKDNRFAISQFLTMLPFVFIGGMMLGV